MAFLFTLFYSNEFTFEPLGIPTFMQMFQHLAQYCSERNISTLGTNIYSISWVGRLKDFIDEDLSSENQKHAEVSLNMERFI